MSGRSRVAYPALVSDSLAVKLDGTLAVFKSKGACEEDGETTGPTFALALRSKNIAAKAALGAIDMTIESPDSYVELPIAPGTLATLTMLSTGNAVFAVRLTYEDDTQDEIAVCGLWLHEHDHDNRVTAVEVKGSGKIAYLITGGIA